MAKKGSGKKKRQYSRAAYNRGANKGVNRIETKKERKPLTLFEKIVLVLLLVFILSIPLALLLHKDIVIYAGLINYFIIGLVILIKPGLVIEIMKKNNEKYQQVTEERIIFLTSGLRVGGIVFVLVGIALVYFLLK